MAELLFVLHRISPAGSPYNEFALAWRNTHHVSVCSYFKPEQTVPDEITLFPGNSTTPGFLHALDQALSAQNYDIVHLHYPHTAVLMLLNNLHRWPMLLPRTVYTVHSSYANYKLRNRLLMLPVFALLRRIVCCSQSSYDSLPKLYRWLAGSRLRVVQNGIDLKRLDAVIRNIPLRPESTTFTIISVGRLVPVKNSIQIVRAFSKGSDPDSRLIMIGEGPLRADVEAAARGQNGQVVLTGLIEREQVFAHLAHADLFVSASWVEGLPIAVMEAMACGCPVILSDIPSHREIARSVDFIPLISPDDTIGFARAIARFKAMPLAERRAIGQQGRNLIVHNFSLDTMHSGYEAIYAKIMH